MSEQETTAAVIARLHGELSQAQNRYGALRDEWNGQILRSAQLQKERDQEKARADSAEAARVKSAETWARRGVRLDQITATCTAAGWPEKLGEDEPAHVLRCVRELKDGAAGQQKRADALATALLVADQGWARMGAELRARAEKAEQALSAAQDLARRNGESAAHLMQVKNQWMDRAMKAEAWTHALASDPGKLARLESELANERDMRAAADQGAVKMCEARNRREAELAKECDKALDRALLGEAKVSQLSAEVRQLRGMVDAVREQLGKLEWAGQYRSGQQLGKGLAMFMAKSCPSCCQVEPSETASQYFTPDQIGHKAGCWFAKKEPAFKHSPNDGADAMRYTIEFHSDELPDKKPRRSDDVKDIKDGRLRVYNNGVPKFQVGEWVTRNSNGAPSEIINREYFTSGPNWSYLLSNGGAFWEQDLTAQAPHHKHGCAGCVFLGRFEKWDLWFDGTAGLPKDLKGVLGADTYHASPAEVPSGHPDPEWFIEAHRRAVARGLIHNKEQSS